MTDDIAIQDVAPRDGLQMQSVWETADKIRLIDAQPATGVSRIEVSAFVSARAIPALRDDASVFAGIERLRGAEAALAARADELNADLHKLPHAA